VRGRAALFAALLLAVSAGAAHAQSYGLATPAPRTTAEGALLARARSREVTERFGRGLADGDRGDWRAAADEFARIIALDPPEPQGSTAYYDLGLAQAQSGDDAHASAAFTEALRRDPGFAAAAANLIVVALRAGDLHAATLAADKLVAIAPRSLRARYQHGLVALRAGDLPSARADFTAVVVSSPAYAVAYYDLAVVDMRAERYDAARAELDRAIALSPGYARARFARATLLVRAGQPAAALVDLDRVLAESGDPSLRDVAQALRNGLAVARP
jgi:tetratricopeptide (TPR) repeat protein